MRWLGHASVRNLHVPRPPHHHLSTKATTPIEITLEVAVDEGQRLPLLILEFKIPGQQGSLDCRKLPPIFAGEVGWNERGEREKG